MKQQAWAPPYPDGIGAEHIRPVGRWARYLSAMSIAVFGVIVALAFSGLLGRERTWIADVNGTRLEVHAPEIIRNGEFFEMRLRVTPGEPIDPLVIGIDAELWTDMTVNTMIPAATEEESIDGELRFTFAALDAGSDFLFKADVQVNPDLLLGNAGTIRVYDGEDALAALRIGITVLP